MVRVIPMRHHHLTTTLAGDIQIFSNCGGWVNFSGNQPHPDVAVAAILQCFVPV